MNEQIEEILFVKNFKFFFFFLSKVERKILSRNESKWNPYIGVFKSLPQ